MQACHKITLGNWSKKRFSTSASELPRCGLPLPPAIGRGALAVPAVPAGRMHHQDAAAMTRPRQTTLVLLPVRRGDGRQPAPHGQPSENKDVNCTTQTLCVVVLRGCGGPRRAVDGRRPSQARPAPRSGPNAPPGARRASDMGRCGSAPAPAGGKDAMGVSMGRALCARVHVALAGCILLSLGVSSLVISAGKCLSVISRPRRPARRRSTAGGAV